MNELEENIKNQEQNIALNNSTEIISEENKEEIKTQDKKELVLPKIFKNIWFYILFFGVISILFFMFTLFNIININVDSKTKEIKVTVNPIIDEKFIKDNKNTIPRKIDGILVDSEQKAKIWPKTAMIENSVDARPLSGINEANIIYETLAEGSITRFLCVYGDDQKINKIGPIRSARPYYAELAEEYNSLFMHFGGSPEALSNIKNGFYNIKNLDGIVYDGTYFWRDQKRSAPHNAYISSDLLNDYIDKIKLSEKTSDFSEWKFSENIPEEYKLFSPANNISLEYSTVSSLYNLKWIYNKDSGKYIRYYANGSKDYDDKDKEITTNNIIVQLVSIDIIDAVGRKKINLTEGGKAIMIRDGHYTEGYWRKNGLETRTRFYFKDNNTEKEFVFKPGKIWINILPKENNFKID